MIPKCPMCGGRNFDRVRSVVRSGSVRYSFLGDIVGRLSPTTLIASLPLKARACMDCGYVALMVDDIEKLHKLASRDEKAFHQTEEEIGEGLDALEQMESEHPQVESSEVLEDLDMSAEEEDDRMIEALETLADVPAAEETGGPGALKDLTDAIEADEEAEADGEPKNLTESVEPDAEDPEDGTDP